MNDGKLYWSEQQDQTKWEPLQVATLRWKVNLFGDALGLIEIQTPNEIPWWRRWLMRIVLGSRFERIE